MARVDRRDVVLPEQPIRPAARRRRRWWAAGALLVLLTLVGAASLLLQTDEPSAGQGSVEAGSIEPKLSPPKLVTLSEQQALDPGPVLLLVTLAETPEMGFDPSYVVPRAGGPAVLLPMSEWIVSAYTRSLSPDGTRFIHDGNNNGHMELIDLRSGTVNRLGELSGYCAQIAPDNRTLAMYNNADDVLLIADAESATARPAPRPPAKRGPEGQTVGQCTGLGWSPDGELLAVPFEDGSFVADRSGRIVHRLRGLNAVNNSMSWSPDGERILMFDIAGGGFVIHHLETGRDAPMTYPAPDALRPQGWAGARVVWLAGQPGQEQRLLIADQRGKHPQTWSRLDVDGIAVEYVSWSRDLAGGR